MTTGAEVAVTTRDQSMTLKQVTDRVNLVHSVLEKVMKKGTHYGTVPGCGAKMVLLKPGADVLAMTFKLVPQFAVSRNDLSGGHREYDVTCSMYGGNGELLGQGVGSASTMEKKYRYRKDDGGKKIENEDIADTYNTVLKIAKKRAHIDATLTVTGAADIFTQDLIDEDAEDNGKPPIPMPTPSPAKSAAPASAPAAHAEATAQPEAGESVVVVLSHYGSKATKRGGQRHYAQGDDGEWYATFDEHVGADLAARSKAATPTRVAFTTDQYGRNIVSLADAPQTNEA